MRLPLRGEWALIRGETAPKTGETIYGYVLHENKETMYPVKMHWFLNTWRNPKTFTCYKQPLYWSRNRKKAKRRKVPA